MALFNEILVGRYNAILSKLLSMKEGAPSPTLATDVTPCLNLDSVDRAEYSFLAGEGLYEAPVLLAASPGNFGFCGLVTPLNSNVLAVVEGILINNENAATAQFNIKQGGGSLGGLFRAWPRDQRQLRPTTVRSSSQVGSGTNAAAQGNLYKRVSLPTGGSIFLPTNYVLGPTDAVANSQIVVESAIANSIVSCSYVWRERVLEPSETR